MTLFDLVVVYMLQRQTFRHRICQWYIRNDVGWCHNLRASDKVMCAATSGAENGYENVILSYNERDDDRDYGNDGGDDDDYSDDNDDQASYSV